MEDGKINPSSPYYLGAGDHPGNTITHVILKGDNYLAWSRAITLSLKSCRKFVFINGTITKPTEKKKLLDWKLLTMEVHREEEVFRQFLIGVDDTLYAAVRTKEESRGIARGKAEIDQTKDSAHAFAVSNVRSKGVMDCHDKSKLSCSHCKKTGHNVEDCFLLHGYPDWWHGVGRGLLALLPHPLLPRLLLPGKAPVRANAMRMCL
uniref:Retrotransposon Copia-like N-terminal domain-containing protein n=1 Tax=Chenopodium quinoa TaxID=63459 RepID=A0A803LXS4_CHEQI